MSYIWINPVIDSMYDAYILDEFLRKYGHKRVRTKTDWGTIVKEKYWKLVSRGETPVADVRCPKIQELLIEMDVAKDVVMPEIDPILIHCGQEISEMEELHGEEKIITTPCQALAEMGNALGLEKTWFVPWNRFVEALGGRPEGTSLKESPIPPGFFEDLGLNTISVTGEEAIRECFSNPEFKDHQLIELLFCKDGCHNGDGIRLCES